MDAISAGLVKFKGLEAGLLSPKPRSPTPGLADRPSKGTPSITNKGLPVPVTAELPLIFIVAAPPGCPLLFTICTPATFP